MTSIFVNEINTSMHKEMKGSIPVRMRENR